MSEGIYVGMSWLDYQKIEAINWSKLSPYLRSAAHGLRGELSSKSADYLTFGQAVHKAVLEPGRFDEDFGTVPEDAPAKRSKDDKAWWARFYAANAGRTMLDADVLRNVKLVAEAVYQHPRANAMLTVPNNRREVVVVARDPVSGMLGKARLDLISQWNGVTYIVDLKNLRDARPYGVAKAIDDYSYHGQLAWYRRLANVVAPWPRECCLITTEQDPAIAVCYDVEADTLDQGDRDVDLAMSRWIESGKTQKWPGYPDGTIGLPAYKLKARA
jgi:hypothetical protein